MARLKINTAKLKLSQPGAKKRLVMMGTTICCALGIGYVTQFGVPGQTRLEGPITVEDITLTAAPAAPQPVLPQPAPPEPAARIQAPVASEIIPASVQEPTPVIRPVLPEPAAEAEADTTPSCAISLTATPAAGAMVDLDLTAPCNLNERVTLHHNGMMFTEVTDATGAVSVTVPVLAEKAFFIASFATGAGTSAFAEVSTLAFYDRVVVQWKGPAGLQLHAREFDAAYFTDGHVWAETAGDLSNTARGEGGFLMRLGREDAPDALMAEIYSFPTGTATRSGEVALTVEAEVTAQNCAQMIEAQTFELKESEIEVHDLQLNIPDCETVGDFLVLKNLLEDLTIAAR